MAGSEAQVEKYLHDTVAELGGFTYKLAVPGRRGYPDRLVKLPNADAFVVELKRPRGGRLSALQVVRHKEMRELGWRVYVCKNREEIDDVIECERRDRPRADQPAVGR